jgi:hypothetical protein
VYFSSPTCVLHASTISSSLILKTPIIFCKIKEIIYLKHKNFFFLWRCGPWRPHSWGFLDHTQWHTTVSRTPLDKWSARHRDLYLTTHNTNNRQTSMPPPSRWAASDPCLRLRGHWDRQNTRITIYKLLKCGSAANWFMYFSL